MEKFTPHEVAKILKTTQPTVQRWISSGILPHTQVRCHYEIEKSDILLFLIIEQLPNGRDLNLTWDERHHAIWDNFNEDDLHATLRKYFYEEYDFYKILGLEISNKGLFYLLPKALGYKRFYGGYFGPMSYGPFILKSELERINTLAKSLAPF